MKASVIIPNLNGAGWLRDSIESIWAQTEQDFELIVIDNGSTDESLEIAHSYCGNPRYHLIENSENTGFSHAVNQGIAMAKGEYMALFNNDAFAEPNWLEELLKTAESDPKIFAVSSLMLRYYEPELADDAGDYMTILGFACKRGDGLKASRYQKPCRIFSACGGAALYRKSILDKIGVFDELFLPTMRMLTSAGAPTILVIKTSIAPPQSAAISAVPPPARYGITHSKAFRAAATAFCCPTKPAGGHAGCQFYPHAAGLFVESYHVPSPRLRQ